MLEVRQGGEVGALMTSRKKEKFKASEVQCDVKTVGAYDITGKVAWLVLAAGLAITAAATLYMKSNAERIADRDFITQCGEIRDVIAGRLDDYARILLGGAALFDASEVVTREKWSTFTQYQRVEKQLPGTQGFGFSLLVPRAELTRHIQEIRSEGFPEYNVKPDGEREIYVPVIYLYPFSGLNLSAFGFDSFSESVRRAGMERARDTNSAVLSGKVLLVQETGKDVQPGTLMYVPVYRRGMPRDSIEQRRNAIYGWVCNVYRMNDLIRGILGGSNLEKAQRLHLRIFDGEQPSPQGLLYESCPSENGGLRNGVRFTRQIPVSFNGHYWALSFTQTGGGLFAAEYTKAWLILVCGVLISLLLFTLILVLLNTRARAQLMAEKLTVDLRAERQRMASIIQGTNVGTWEWNVQTGNIVLNNIWAQIIGYTLDELAPISIKTWETLTHPDDVKHSGEMLERHFSGEIPFYDCECRMKHKDGHWVWIQDRGQLITRTDDGKPLMMFGTHSDISESKRAEEEKLKIEAQLRQTQKLESIGQLAGGVAHDFNNMLSVINGYSDMLLGEMNPSDPKYERVQEIHKAAEHSVELTKQLLAFARRQPIAPKVLDFNDTIAGMIKMLQRLIGENIELILKPAANLWKVKMDPSQVNQILANLIVNARDAISGIGKITIETGNAELDESSCEMHPDFIPGKYVVLSVSDNGCGMDNKTIEHIFEPFFTTKKVGEGTGLGLATVFGIVTQNNGYINTCSEPGKGTTFNIYLPRHESDGGIGEKHDCDHAGDEWPRIKG